MAKKKGTKATKAKQAGTAKPRTSTKATRAAAGETATAAAPHERVRDPRLPPPGTIIEKRDRHGAVRCKCTVEADGVRYGGKLYRSISAAALAAARDLGQQNRTFNGFTWWGLSKPPRRGAEPIEALGRAWDRYRERAASVVAAVTDENREQVRGAIEKHAEAIKDLRRKVG